MRYSIFVYVDSKEHFLQSSHELNRVKQPKATLDRWINEMGIIMRNIRGAKFVIMENGVPILTKPYTGNGSRIWAEI